MLSLLYAHGQTEAAKPVRHRLSNDTNKMKQDCHPRANKQESGILGLVHSSVTGWQLCLADSSNTPKLQREMLSLSQSFSMFMNKYHPRSVVTQS